MVEDSGIVKTRWWVTAVIGVTLLISATVAYIASQPLEMVIKADDNTAGIFADLNGISANMASISEEMAILNCLEGCYGSAGYVTGTCYEYCLDLGVMS